MTTLVIHRLADRPEWIPRLVRGFEQEWPDWYGPDGRGDAARDLRGFCSRNAPPIGLIGLLDGELVGCVALKSESIAARADLGPWAAVGLVLPGHRGRGYGGQLVGALENLARELGYPVLFCGTATAASLLERLGWSLLDTVAHDGKQVRIYQKTL